MPGPAAQLDDALREKLAEVTRRRDDLARQLLDPDVLADHRRVRDLSIRKAALDPVADAYLRLLQLEAEADEYQDAIDAGEDTELVEMAREELPRVRTAAAEGLGSALESLVNADDNAIGSVVLELRAGVGGDEAGIWARDLLAMYRAFADARGWNAEIMDIEEDDAAGTGGVRSATMTIAGEGVWSTLAHEAGTHCVKRVPATESQGRVHTSTATVAVLPEPEDVDFELNHDDVDEHVTTAQGPGGQNVNKVATAVHLIHRPTGVEVRMQETKSQRQNREKAWRLLRARLFEAELERRRAAEAEQRSAQIGSAGRAERIRTYRWKDNIAVDHRLGESFSLQSVMAGDLGDLTTQLQQQETARRLEAL
jgi:peptide chain release factor 1